MSTPAAPRVLFPKLPQVPAIAPLVPLPAALSSLTGAPSLRGLDVSFCQTLTAFMLDAAAEAPTASQAAAMIRRLYEAWFMAQYDMALVVGSSALPSAHAQLLFLRHALTVATVVTPRLALLRLMWNMLSDVLRKRLAPTLPPEAKAARALLATATGFPYAAATADGAVRLLPDTALLTQLRDARRAAAACASDVSVLERAETDATAAATGKDGGELE